MDLLLKSTNPPQKSENWMKRYFKPIVVALSLIAALFLTFFRQEPNGTIDILANSTTSAAPGRKAKNYNLTALKVFNVALVRVKDSYVKPTLIKPKQMLVSALDAVEKTVAEVLDNAPARNLEGGNESCTRVAA